MRALCLLLLAASLSFGFQMGHSAAGGRAFVPAGRGAVAGFHTYHTPLTPGLILPAGPELGPLRGGFYGGVRPNAFYHHRDFHRYREIPWLYFTTPYYYPDLTGPLVEEVPVQSASAQASEDNRLAEQIQRLGDEIAALRASQQQNNLPAPPPQNTQAADSSVRPITLVLRDGTQFDVRNYAVMDRTFWDFSGPTPHRIPVGSIDIETSTRLTEQRGVEFPHFDAGQ